ncbi:DUF1203 domain-containing protein [Agarivorans sp. QJM3NY_29]|uniref:DUF1203 domain-containing protein n=1 Tax=unclassified Agarivorans TaxID=2636026 RepID=UPI003D7E3AA1
MALITPIRPDFLLKARNAGLDDQNQAVVFKIAEGGEPCRDILRRARAGEKIILASYCPFGAPGPYKEYGPIFIRAQASDEQPDLTQLPLPSGKDTDYLGQNFVLRAYNRGEEIVDAELVSPSNAQLVLDNFLSNPVVEFVLLRFAAYGCYALKIERD